MARLLVDHGAIASAACVDGWTPLHSASQNGHEAVARLLIDHGAIAWVAKKDGSTPLHFAALFGHEAVARLLIDYGAIASAADEVVAGLLRDQGAFVTL